MSQKQSAKATASSFFRWMAERSTLQTASIAMIIGNSQAYQDFLAGQTILLRREPGTTGYTVRILKNPHTP